MFVGVGAARVRDLFSQAEAKAPCIVFIDELDALGKVRVQSPMGSHEEREQTLNQLLAEMDGFDPRKAIIIMGATNRPEVLDPALLRPGRFDRQVLVDKPDVKGREEVLRIHVRNVKLSPEVDLKKVAARTAGFAGADLANLVNEAALLAARRDKTMVDMRDFDEAIDRLIAGLEKKRVMSTKEREIVAYHESGHAIVASALPGTDPVHKISIVARGFGALGYTMQLPLEDRYLMQRRDLMNQLAHPARRPLRRRDRARRDLDRRAERPAARHRHRALDGHRVGHERAARRGQLRRAAGAAASSTCRRAPSAARTAKKPPRRSTKKSKMIVTEAHNDARRILHRQARHPRKRHAAPAREGSHGGRRAARDPRRHSHQRRRRRSATDAPGDAIDHVVIAAGDGRDGDQPAATSSTTRHAALSGMTPARRPPRPPHARSGSCSPARWRRSRMRDVQAPQVVTAARVASLAGRFARLRAAGASAATAARVTGQLGGEHQAPVSAHRLSADVAATIAPAADDHVVAA